MKKAILIVLLLVFLGGCGWVKQSWSHTKSGIVELNRTITLYAENGSVISQWEGRCMVEVNGSTARFIHDGHVVMISGTFTAVEN